MTRAVPFWGGPIDSQVEEIEVRSDGHLPHVLQVAWYDGVHTYELVRLMDEKDQDTGHRRYEHRGLSYPTT